MIELPNGDREYSVGDEVWYVPRGRSILIRCKITEVDDQWRKKHPAGILFYDLDEPVGYSLDEQDLAVDRKEGESWLKECEYKDSPTLLEFREKTLKGIMKTWGNDHPHTLEEMMASYPVKEKGKDWINLNDLNEPAKFEDKLHYNFVIHDENKENQMSHAAEKANIIKTYIDIAIEAIKIHGNVLVNLGIGDSNSNDTLVKYTDGQWTIHCMDVPMIEYYDSCEDAVNSYWENLQNKE